MSDAIPLKGSVLSDKGQAKRQWLTLESAGVFTRSLELPAELGAMGRLDSAGLVKLVGDLLTLEERSVKGEFVACTAFGQLPNLKPRTSTYRYHLTAEGLDLEKDGVTVRLVRER